MAGQSKKCVRARCVRIPFSAVVQSEIVHKMYKVGLLVLGIRMLKEAKAKFVARLETSQMQEGQDDIFTLPIGPFSPFCLCLLLLFSSS